MRKLLSVLAGLVGLVYIINPTAGIIELIPDNLPVVGNLDEAAATLLIVAAVKAFMKKDED